ncbi:protein LLP homolog [Cylas formicarius]|uniref:protein LLP homolog n=1 Tax=Cylas formicarius TaxID=197179 RepID=UPI0029584B51|nr:protein LLP homolog [Cylas formicarius]
MAKSIRSKWKRKCRAIKRIRYGQKELEILKKTLGNEYQNENEAMAVTNLKDVSNTDVDNETHLPEPSKEHMDIDEIKNEFNTRTLRNKNGAYPVWLHPRKIRCSKKAKKRKAKGL